MGLINITKSLADQNQLFESVVAKLNNLMLRQVGIDLELGCQHSDEFVVVAVD